MILVAIPLLVLALWGLLALSQWLWPEDPPSPWEELEMDPPDERF